MIPLLALTVRHVTVATIAGQVLRLTRPGRTTRNVNLRIAAWWVLCTLTGGALLLGSGALTYSSSVVSFLALREYITITRPARATSDAARLLLPLHSGCSTSSFGGSGPPRLPF